MEPSNSHDVNLPVDRLESKSARSQKPEFALRFELGGGVASGRLIPNPFAEPVGPLRLRKNPV
jgi:hypothetical protein